ncbi:transposase [Flavobacteriales bacterium DA487]
MTVVGWVDVFTRPNLRDVIIDSLRYCIKEKGLNLFAYCLMTNHLNMIVNADEPFQLKDTIRDFKKFTSKKIIEQIKEEPESRREWMLNLFSFAAKTSSKHKEYRLWQAGNHAIGLYSEKFVWDKINYIHNNPVRAGFVKRIEDWKYSSAANYMELNDLVLEEVIRLNPRLQTFS